MLCWQWRFPAPYTKLYPPVGSIELAAHPTMDASVPPIAHHTPDLQFQNGGNPYVKMNDTLAQHDRLYYYSAVSWVDSRIGAVLDELDKQELTQETLVVMHSDHGWVSAACPSIRQMHARLHGMTYELPNLISFCSRSHHTARQHLVSLTEPWRARVSDMFKQGCCMLAVSDSSVSLTDNGKSSRTG